MKKLILLLIVVAILVAVIVYIHKKQTASGSTTTNTDASAGGGMKFLKGAADFIAISPAITLANGKQVYYKKAVSNTTTNTSEVHYYDSNKNDLNLSLKDAMEVSTKEKVNKLA